MIKILYEAFEGGANHGNAYPSAISTVENALGKMYSPKHFAGTSAGAITALMRSLGLLGDEIASASKRQPWSDLTSYRGNFGMLWRLLRRSGLYSTNNLKQIVEDLLLSKNLSSNITFMSLRRRTGNTLKVVATEYLSDNQNLVPYAEPFVFCYENSPDVKVVDAVVASAAIPVFFEVMDIDGRFFSDGGVVLNNPSALFKDVDPDEFIAYKVSTKKDKVLENDDKKGSSSPLKPSILQLIGLTLSLMRRTATEAYIPSAFYERTVDILIDGNESAFNFEDYQDNPEFYNALYEYGKKGAEQWLIKTQNNGKMR